MAGYKENFGANVDYAYGRGVNDIGGRLQRGMAGISGAGKDVASFAAQASSARNGIKDLKGEIRSLKDQKLAAELAKDSRAAAHFAKKINDAARATDTLQKRLNAVPFAALERGLGGITKGLISFNTSILSMAFDFLINSIKRVYDLQEKWTHAIGGFNMKLGGMTKGLQGAQKAAVQWSSTIRGLTNGSIEEGIQMFGEFTTAMGRTVEAGDKFVKLGVQMARGFGIGGGGAGQILKVFENIGMSADDSAVAMKTAITAANEAGIPVNMLAEDLSKSVTYMARFGKEGQKTLIQGAAWARKYDMTLEQLKNTVEGFDMFDDAARSASKLNTAFGTMINSMDLMMEDDPAKRLDAIRQQMLAQGMTYDKLTPKQRRYFSETLKLSEDQAAALLDSRNAHESYSDFAAKAASKEKQEISAKKMMEKQLRATAQTMYAFGMAFDRITIAIGKAIRPLLEVFGLAKKGGKEFGGFASVMENITTTVEKFFVSLSENKNWNKFMMTLADDLKRAGTALKDFVMSGKAADLVGDIAVAMKKFYTWVRDAGIMAAKMLKPLIPVFVLLTQHLDKLVIAWGAFKAFNTVKGFTAGMSGPKNESSDGVDWGSAGDPFEGGGKRKGKGLFKPSTSRGAAGAVAGLGTALASGGGAGAMAGGAIGGLIGAFVPFIGPLLGPAGAAIGGMIEEMFGKGKSDLEIAQEKYQKQLELYSSEHARFSETLKIAGAEQQARDAIRNRADQQIMGLKKGQIDATKVDTDLLKARVADLQGFGKNTKMVAKAMDQLNTNGKLSKDMLKAVADASIDYNKQLTDLRTTAAALAAQQRSSIEFAQAEVAKAGMDRQILDAERDLKNSKGTQTEAGKKIGEGGLFGDKATAAITAKLKADKEVQDKEKKLIELKAKMEEKKFAMDQKLFYIDTREKMMGTEDFLKFKKGLGETSMSDMDIFKKYAIETGAAKDFGLTANDVQGITKLATGGIVTKPTRALIGEAGPEAVIPLSKGRNYAGGSVMGGETVTTQIAEVTLDGQKVGRAIVRNVIRGRN